MSQQALINANQKSVTESKMVEASQGFLPTYSNEPSLPPLGIQAHQLPPTINITGSPAGKSLTIRMPAGAGFLYDASVKVKATYDLDDNDNPQAPIALNMLRSLEWYCQGRPLVYKSGAAILAQILTWKDPDYQKACLYYAKMLDDNEAVVTSGATSFVTYIPLIDSFLTAIERAVLLDKVNDLELKLTFNTADESGLITADGITALQDVTCFAFTYVPRLSSYNQMVMQDWDKKFIMPWVNTMTEYGDMSTGTLSKKTVITCPFLTLKTHLRVVSRSGVNGFGIKNIRIKNITFNLNGNPIFNSTPLSRLNNNAIKYGRGACNVVASKALTFSDEIATIDWGVLAGRASNSGTAFFQELQGSNVTVEITESVTAADYQLVIVHEYFNTVMYDPAGTLSIDSNN